MRRSYKTGEFWLASAAMVAGFATLIYGINKGADLLGIAAVLGAIYSPTITQILGRNKLKEKTGE